MGKKVMAVVKLQCPAGQANPAPPVGPMGKAYAAKLESLASDGDFEALVCHFYNFYFAHTAGGRMIGKMMSDKLLGGKKLQVGTVT